MNRFVAAFALTIVVVGTAPAFADCLAGVNALSKAEDDIGKAEDALANFIGTHKAKRNFCEDDGPKLYDALDNEVLSAWAIGQATKKQCVSAPDDTKQSVEDALVQVSEARKATDGTTALFAGCTR